MGNDIDGEADDDRSGYSVSVSAAGTIVASGAYTAFTPGWWQGTVRVYEWDGTSWSQMGNDIDGEAAQDKSGNSVSLSSDGTIIAMYV